jgi:hypothetical protein
MNLAPVAAAAVAAWQPLPAVPDLGYSAVDGVRVGHLAVFVAGATYDATTVQALAYDLRTRRWRRLPRAPLRWRSGQTTLAAGGRVIVWGGASNTGRLRGGAVYDTGARRWRRMPRAPVEGFERQAVWTGREMIVPAGAAYDPARNRWRAVAPAPFRARAAVWTGRRVLILGAREAAAYDPGTDRWRALAPPPIRAMDTPRAAWTGARMLVFNGARGATYDPGRDRWRLMGRPPLAHRHDFTAVWDGTRLLIWGGVRNDCGDCFLADGAAFRPRRHRWHRLPAAPLAARDRHAAVPLRRGGMVVWAGCCRGTRQLADGAVLRLSTRERPAATAGPRRRAVRARCRAARARR